MTVIHYIQKELDLAKINEDFLYFYNKSSSFKIKFFSPIVCAITIPWVFFIFNHFNSYINSFTDGLFYFNFFCTMPSLLSILGLSYLTSINGFFFKSVSYFFPKYKNLTSFINRADYQDNIILSLYENKSFIDSVLKFYLLLDNINFASSYHHNEVNYRNKEIKENLDKLKSILTRSDKSGFISFFRNKFIDNYNCYSNHEKVLSFLNLTSNSNENGESKNNLKNDDTLEAMNEELNLKNKFKKVL